MLNHTVTAANINKASREELVKALRPYLGEAPRSARAASWDRPEVAEARRTQHHVKANGAEYRSVRAAFEALGLPVSKHIAFRKSLKATGRAVFGDGDRKVRFSLIR